MTIDDMGDLAQKSMPDLIDIALACDEGPKFWYVTGLISGMTDPMNGPITRALLKAGRSWNYAEAYRVIATLKK